MDIQWTGGDWWAYISPIIKQYTPSCHFKSQKPNKKIYQKMSFSDLITTWVSYVFFLSIPVFIPSENQLHTTYIIYFFSNLRINWARNIFKSFCLCGNEAFFYNRSKRWILHLFFFHSYIILKLSSAHRQVIQREKKKKKKLGPVRSPPWHSPQLSCAVSTGCTEPTFRPIQHGTTRHHRLIISCRHGTTHGPAGPQIGFAVPSH